MLFRTQASAAGDHGRLYRASERFGRINGLYVDFDLVRNILADAGCTPLTICVTSIAFDRAEGLLPQQDTGGYGRNSGRSGFLFNAMKQRMTRFVEIIQADPAVASVGLHGAAAARRPTPQGVIS